LLIEKPLSTSFDQVDELMLQVKRRELQAGMAYVMRCHPLIQRLKQSIDSNELGAPVELVASAGQHFPFYRPDFREIYYAKKETGGGAIQDALTHTLNTTQWIVGRSTRVCADAARLSLPGVEVEDTVHVLARHGALLANYALNQHQYVNDGSLTIVCERGCWRFELTSQRLLRGDTPGGDWKVVAESKYLERDDLFVRQADAAIDMSRRIQPPLCTLTEGAETMAACLAMLKSAQEQRWVDVEPFGE